MTSGANKSGRSAAAHDQSIPSRVGSHIVSPVALRLERKQTRKQSLSRGFTLLELMIVLSVMMILMAISVPLYQHHIIAAREAVLKQNLDTLDKVLEQYRMDKRESPQTFDDLVTAGYLHQLPIDPMTGKPDWVAEQEETANALDPQQTGIFRAHSASTGTALSGEAYSTW